MAVLKNLILAASVLTPLVAAIPMPGANKRDIHTNTVTEIEWITVEETTTVWVDPSDPTPAPVVAAAATTTDAVPAVTTTPATYASTTMMTVAAAPQAPAPQAPAPPVSSAAPVYTPSPEAPVVPSSAAPVETSTAAAAWTPASSSAAPAATLSPKATTGTDGTCEGSGDACQGDVTHWDGGLGACGWNVNTNSDMQIALPYQFMGTQSNGNPYCGRSVTLVNPTSGTTVQATVGDKCMGCVDRAIDCTDALFNAITDGTGDGRVSGIQWFLN